MQGDSLESQKTQIKLKANSMNVKIIKWFELIQSASGDYQPSQEAVDYCKDPTNKIRYLFIKSIDRFTRAGAASYASLKNQLDKINVDLVDVYGVISGQKINTLAHTGLKFFWSEFTTSTSLSFA